VGYETSLKLTSIPAGTQWWRIQHCRHASGLFWGRQLLGRWNDPNGRFGVLYASDSVDAAFAETFGRELMNSLAPASVKFISRQELAERCVARLWAERDLQMLDFTGPALQALNLDARLLHSCDALEVCHHWARWVHGAPEQPDGLLYPSRLLPRSRNAAVFERCADAWREEPLGNLLSWQGASGESAVFQLLDDQGWGLVD
jgi:RES domain-containing protein